MLSQLKRVNLLASASSKQIQGSRLRLQHVRNQVNATQSPKKVVIQSTSPPPPPPGAGAQSWGKSVVILGLGGAAIYWRNEIFEKLGVFQDEELSADVPSTGEIVTEVKKAAAVAKSSVETTVEEIKEALKKIEKIVPVEFENGKVDWEQVKGTIVDILDSESSSAYEDGSFGPLWVRLAWHNAGTFTKSTGVGGSEGAAMRFKSEGSWGANAGLDLARATLEPVKTKYPQVSYSDIWSYAGTIAIEEMGGPEVTKMWRGGRKDKTQEQDNEKALPDGLLPDADGREHKEKPQQHVRDIFYRMGFDDKGMVALCGAHALGRCHESRSGYWGPWTSAPTTFSNEYFRLLVEEKWSKKKTHQGKPWTGPEQYESADGKLMMLPSDMALVWDPEFKKHVETYAKDEDLFFKDFAKAWIKLQEVGVKEFNGWRKYIFFGERV